MTRVLGGLSLPEAAEAVHAGRVVDADGHTVHWEPIETVLPVSERLRALVSGPEYEAAVQRETAGIAIHLAPAVDGAKPTARVR
jgi:hypothetical protein